MLSCRSFFDTLSRKLDLPDPTTRLDEVRFYKKAPMGALPTRRAADVLLGREGQVLPRGRGVAERLRTLGEALRGCRRAVETIPKARLFWREGTHNDLRWQNRLAEGSRPSGDGVDAARYAGRPRCFRGLHRHGECRKRRERGGGALANVRLCSLRGTVGVAARMAARERINPVGQPRWLSWLRSGGQPSKSHWSSSSRWTEEPLTHPAEVGPRGLQRDDLLHDPLDAPPVVENV